MLLQWETSLWRQSSLDHFHGMLYLEIQGLFVCIPLPYALRNWCCGPRTPAEHWSFLQNFLVRYYVSLYVSPDVGPTQGEWRSPSKGWEIQGKYCPVWILFSKELTLSIWKLPLYECSLWNLARITVFTIHHPALLKSDTYFVNEWNRSKPEH